jgi:hypothetical protein
LTLPGIFGMDSSNAVVCSEMTAGASIEVVSRYTCLALGCYLSLAVR